MAIPLLAVHLKSNLGLGAASIGTVLTIHLLSARLLPAVTGPLADWLGARGLMVGGLLLRAFGLGGVAYFENVATLSLMAFLMGAGTSLYESAVYGILGRQPQKIAPRIFIVNNQALNAGVIVGPLLGTFIATLGTPYAFMASAAAFLILAYWTAVFDIATDVPFKNVSMWQSIRVVVKDRAFIFFLISTLPWWFLFSQLYVVFPIYITDIGGNKAFVGAMFLVNGIAGLIFMFVSVFVFQRMKARKILATSYIGLALIYPLALVSHSVWWFLVIVCLYTIAETHILPAIETITAEMAKQGSESTYFGAASLAWALAGSVGNYAGSWLILEGAPDTVWIVFSVVACIGASMVFWLKAITANTSSVQSEIVN